MPLLRVMRHVIGQEISEQLDYVPAKLTVIEHVRLTYACRHCEQTTAESGSQVITADKLTSPIEKGLAAPGLLSYVIVSKWSDHLPLYRLETILERHGIEIARSTMCDWAAGCRSAPAAARVDDERVLQSRIIHTDDTPVNVLDKNRSQTRTGALLVYLGDGDHPYTVFTFTASRSRDGPREFLRGWSGYLQADAFGGYDGIYAARSWRPGDRSGLLGPCRKVLRGPHIGCRRQHPGVGLHPAALRHRGLCEEIICVGASVFASGSRRAAPAAIQNMAAIPAGRARWSGPAQEPHGPGHHVYLESVGALCVTRRTADLPSTTTPPRTPCAAWPSAARIGYFAVPTTAVTPPPSSSVSWPRASATESNPSLISATCSPASPPRRSASSISSCPTAGKPHVKRLLSPTESPPGSRDPITRKHHAVGTNCANVLHRRLRSTASAARMVDWKPVLVIGSECRYSLSGAERL